MPSPTSLSSIRADAIARRDRGDLTSARSLLEKALEAATMATGEDHPEVLTTAHLLANLHRQAGDLSGARRVLENALYAGTHRHGEDHPMLLSISFDLAEIADELGNRHEARKHYNRIAKFGPAAPGFDQQQVQAARAWLGPSAPAAAAFSGRSVTLPAPEPIGLPQPPAAPAASPYSPPADSPYAPPAATPSAPSTRPEPPAVPPAAPPPPPFSPPAPASAAPASATPSTSTPTGSAPATPASSTPFATPAAAPSGGGGRHAAPDPADVVERAPAPPAYSGPPPSYRPPVAPAAPPPPPVAPAAASYRASAPQDQPPAATSPSLHPPARDAAAEAPTQPGRQTAPGEARSPGSQTPAVPFQAPTQPGRQAAGPGAAQQSPSGYQAPTSPAAQTPAAGSFATGSGQRDTEGSRPQERASIAQAFGRTGPAAPAEASAYPAAAPIAEQPTQEGVQPARIPSSTQTPGTYQSSSAAYGSVAGGQDQSGLDAPTANLPVVQRPAALPERIAQPNLPAVTQYPPATTVHHGQILPRAPKRRGRGMLVASLAAALVAVVAAGVTVFLVLQRDSTTTEPPVGPGGEATNLTLEDRGDKVTLTWSDPSNGAAQPIVVGNRQNEATRRMDVPARGATKSTLLSLNKNYEYCFSILLAYTVDDIRQSEQVCTNRKNPTPSPSPTR